MCQCSGVVVCEGNVDVSVSAIITMIIIRLECYLCIHLMEGYYTG